MLHPTRTGTHKHTHHLHHILSLNELSCTKVKKNANRPLEQLERNDQKHFLQDWEQEQLHPSRPASAAAVTAPWIAYNYCHRKKQKQKASFALRNISTAGIQMCRYYCTGPKIKTGVQRCILLQRPDTCLTKWLLKFMSINKILKAVFCAADKDAGVGPCCSAKCRHSLHLKA